MRATPLRLIAALGLLGTASVAQASSPRPSSSAALDVGMYCEYGYCEAVASGGSGTYSFEWLNAWELTDDGGPISGAEPLCYTSSNVSITVTVKDSNGATATAKRWYTYC